MRLKVGQNYRMHLSDGSSHDVTVLSYEGDKWYRVKTASGEFFFNLRQVVRLRAT